jgi:hypothetical protein
MDLEETMSFDAQYTQPCGSREAGGEMDDGAATAIVV